MKEMEYTKKHIREILDHGCYKGYNYWIISLGTHPVAYVEIPSTNGLYQRHYEESCGSIECHYGITYSEAELVVLEYSEKYKCEVMTILKDSWFIGWDYAHSGDYYGRYNYPKYYFAKEPVDKKWTTSEILSEVKEVIKQVQTFEGVKL